MYINGLPCQLVYNEDLLLPTRECNVGIAFGSELSNWVFRFSFTDYIPPTSKALSSTTTYENDGKTVIFTYYAWFGNDIEANNFHYIESKNLKIRAFIKIRTSASRGIDTRKAHICIWKVTNKP